MHVRSKHHHRYLIKFVCKKTEKNESSKSIIVTSVTNSGLLVDNSVWKWVIHVAMLSSKNSGKSCIQHILPMAQRI